MSETIFVQSKIRPTATDLTPSTYRKWYEQVHIPDLLRTPGITSVLRYAVSSSSDSTFPTTSEFPYLAVYPRVESSWLRSETCEFLRVPLHSDLLPGPSHFVFDVADFVMGAYEGVAGETVGAPAKHLVVVSVDKAAITEGDGTSPEDILRQSLQRINAPASAAKGSTLLKYDFSPTKKEPRHAEIAAGRVFVGGDYVAIHAFDEVPAGLTPVKGAVLYDLIGAFGDITQ